MASILDEGEAEAARRERESRLKTERKAGRFHELKLERARQFAAGELAMEDLKYQELQEQCKLHGVPGKTLAGLTTPELLRRLRAAMSEGEGQPEAAPAPPHDASVSDVSSCAACDNDGLFATAEFWREEAQRKHPGNAHLRQLFDAPWLPQLLGAPGSGRLWRGRRRALFKELTEGYAVLLRVQAAATSAGCAADGRGVTVFDCCSGKGLASLVPAHTTPHHTAYASTDSPTHSPIQPSCPPVRPPIHLSAPSLQLLSVALPAAHVVALDSNRQMDLSHLAGRANVRFHALDIHSDDFSALLSREARGAQMACMVRRLPPAVVTKHHGQGGRSRGGYSRGEYGPDGVHGAHLSGLQPHALQAAAPRAAGRSPTSCRWARTCAAR